MSEVLEQDFASASGEPIDGAPKWFNTLRAEGQKSFEALEWPTKKIESWRFGRPKNSQITEIALAEEEGMVMDIEPAPEGVIRFTFVNGFCMSIEGEVPEGVLAQPLNRALYEDGDAIKDLIPVIQGKLGSGKLAAYHRANLEDGAIIHVGAGVELESPIEIVNLFTGEGRSQSYLLLVAGEGAKVSVIESFQSTNDTDASTVLSVLDVKAEKGSDLKYVCTQELNDESQLIRIGESEVGEQANAKTAVVHTGGKWVRDELYSTVAGNEANSTILSVTVPRGTQEYDQRTFQRHASPHCYSELLYKNALYDKSKTIFSGLIFVDEGAHYTDAYQTCRNLMMSDTSEANSLPGLEINADQVKCSHGSTSAQISDEEIFYLQARGISAKAARQIIAEGFCADVFQKLGNEKLEAIACEALARSFS